MTLADCAASGAKAPRARPGWPRLCAATLATSLALGAASGCGGENSLSGSLGDQLSLDISAVAVRRNDEALQISYTFSRDVAVDLVIQVGVALTGVELKPGVPVPLQGEYAPGHRRTTVIHAPAGEPQRFLPPIERGDLTLSAGGDVSELTKGSFSMRFKTSGGDVGGGTTLTGTFAATALDAGFGELP